MAYQTSCQGGWTFPSSVPPKTRLLEFSSTPRENHKHKNKKNHLKCQLSETRPEEIQLRKILSIKKVFKPQFYIFPMRADKLFLESKLFNVFIVVSSEIVWAWHNSSRIITTHSFIYVSKNNFLGVCWWSSKKSSKNLQINSQTETDRPRWDVSVGDRWIIWSTTQLPKLRAELSCWNSLRFHYGFKYWN